MTTTSATTLYTALLAFQRAVGPVKKDASNPAFRTKYATLQSVLETVEGPLSDNGLVLLQRFQASDTGPMLISEIVHAASGESVSSAIDVVGKDMTDPQKVGGAITYYRRYSLLALLGLAPEDDDGNSAAKPAPRQQEQPRPQQPAPAAPAANGTDPPLTAKEFETTIDHCWTKVENGHSLDSIKGYLNAARVRMSEAQRLVARQQLTKIEEAIAERAAPSIAG